MYVIFVCGYIEIWNLDFKGDFRFSFKEIRDGFMQVIEIEIFFVTCVVYVCYFLKIKYLKVIVRNC